VFTLIEPEFDELAGRTLVVLGAGSIGRSCETDQQQALPNLLLTPPVALSSRQARERLVQALAEHVRAYPAERGKCGG
jgi:phosphoglycerate dehydrogenase-like enzyme